MIPVPLSVTPCAANAVFEITSVVDGADTTFVNVNDVEVAVLGVHVYVNTVPVDPDNDPIVPFDADVNAMVGSVVEHRNVAVIVSA